MAKLYDNSTKERPLLFFESFINKQSLEKFEDMFFGYPVNDSQACNLKEGYIEYLKDTYINEEVRPVRVYFKDELRKLLQSNLNITRKYIEEREVELNYQNSKSDIFIQSILDKLSEIKIELCKIEKYQDILVHVVNKLSDFLVSKVNQPKAIISKKTSLNGSSKSYFDLKYNVYTRHLQKLYTITVEHDVIDEEVVSEVDFLNVFQQPILPIKDLHFTFSCNNRKAIVYFEAIKPLFKNLTPARISKSMTFYTKPRNILESKVLNAGDFNKVTNYFKKNPSTAYEPLQNAIKLAFPKSF